VAVPVAKTGLETETPTRANLLNEFQLDEQSCFESGRRNNITDIALTVASVLGSLTATILVATTAYKPLIASAAAIPAACTSLQKIVDFRGRSLWYFQHSANLKALGVALKYATDPNLEEHAKKRADLELEAETRWAQIGSGKEVPSVRSKLTRNLKA
jgi:hypothetical protein